jgi:hypothetical protein
VGPYIIFLIFYTFFLIFLLTVGIVDSMITSFALGLLLEYAPRSVSSREAGSVFVFICLHI